MRRLDRVCDELDAGNLVTFHERNWSLHFPFAMKQEDLGELAILRIS